MVSCVYENCIDKSQHSGKSGHGRLAGVRWHDAQGLGYSSFWVDRPPQCNIFILICFCLALEHNRLPPGSAFRKLLVVLSRHNGLLGIEHKKSPVPIVFRSSIILIFLCRYFSPGHTQQCSGLSVLGHTPGWPQGNMGCWGLNPARLMQEKCPTHYVLLLQAHYLHLCL